MGASRARRVECRPTSARARRTLIAYSRNDNPHRYPTIGAARAWPRQASIRFGDRPGTTAGYGFSYRGFAYRPRPPLHALPATARPHRSALDDACRRSHRGARGAGAFRRSRTDRTGVVKQAGVAFGLVVVRIFTAAKRRGTPACVTSLYAVRTVLVITAFISFYSRSETARARAVIQPIRRDCTLNAPARCRQP